MVQVAREDKVLIFPPLVNGSVVMQLSRELEGVRVPVCTSKHFEKSTSKPVEMVTYSTIYKLTSIELFFEIFYLLSRARHSKDAFYF